MLIKEYLDHSYDNDVKTFWDPDMVRSTLEELCLTDTANEKQYKDLIVFIDKNYVRLNALTGRLLLLRDEQENN